MHSVRLGVSNRALLNRSDEFEAVVKLMTIGAFRDLAAMFPDVGYHMALSLKGEQ